jgi:hypothetical protein
MIYEWKPNSLYRNFGDALTEKLSNSARFSSKERMERDSGNLYFLIGSVITNDILSLSLSFGLRPVFLNCGWRGEPLSKDLASQAVFFGARGPLTQAALRDVGVNVEVTGDAAYALKPLNRKSILRRTSRFEHLVFPHVLSVEGPNSPSLISSSFDLSEKIKMISQAEFVLGGAMHACIIAHHFGVPFAPYAGSDGYVDCPIKWQDWFMSIGLPPESLFFSRDASEGKDWYDSVQNVILSSPKVSYPNRRTMESLIPDLYA